MRKKRALFIILLIIWLAGCGMEEAQSTEKVSETKLPGNIEVCVEDKSFPKTVEYWEVEAYELDLEKVKEMVFPEVTMAYNIRQGQYADTTILETMDGEFYINSDHFSFRGAKGNVLNEYTDILNARYRVDTPIVEERVDLEFKSVAELEGEIYEIFGELFPNLEIKELLIETYSLKYLQQLQKTLMADPDERDWVSEHNWTKEKEAYYFRGSLALNGIPFNETNYMLQNDTYINECYLEGYVNRDGFICLGVLAAYQFADCEEKEIISWKEALSGAVADRYSNSTYVYKDKILDVELQYMFMPDSFTGKQYTMPIWVFTREYVVEKDSELLTKQKEVLVNAITGRLVE